MTARRVCLFSMSKCSSLHSHFQMAYELIFFEGLEEHRNLPFCLFRLCIAWKGQAFYFYQIWDSKGIFPSGSIGALLRCRLHRWFRQPPPPRFIRHRRRSVPEPLAGVLRGQRPLSPVSAPARLLPGWPRRCRCGRLCGRHRSFPRRRRRICPKALQGHHPAGWGTAGWWGNQ